MTYQQRQESEPSALKIAEWMQFIGDTGQPELCEGLYQGKLKKDVKYKILRHVHINRKKRPNRDKAPCPMCTKNKFLRGSLVYLFEMNCCAVIGHCCAEYAYLAEREYDRKRLLDWQEDYLILALPGIGRKQRTVRALGFVAQELWRVFRTLRRNAPELVQQLRNLKQRQNAMLVLYDVEADTAPEDYFGPAGFRGGSTKRGATEYNFGPLRGSTIVIRDYDPLRELRDVERNFSIVDPFPDDEAIIDFIATLGEKERTATVASLQIGDARFDKFAGRAQDAIEFFSEENIANLQRYGSHSRNPLPFKVGLETVGSHRLLNIDWGGKRAAVSIDRKLFDVKFDWSSVPYAPFHRRG